jgi:tetratricopeptide (TPR) repeat protein
MKSSRIIALIMLVPFLFIVSGCSKSPVEKRDAYLKSAASYVKDGKYAEAAIQYQNALKIAPDDSSTLMALGEVQLKRMRGDEAYKAFYRAAAADPKNTKAHEYLAYMQILAKKYDMAEKEARAILAYDPANHDAKQILAQALYNTGKKDEAIAIANELLKAPKPGEAEFSNAANMYMGINKPDDALATISRGISFYPGSTKLKFLASDILAAKGDLPGARKWAEDAYQSNRKDLTAGLGLARFYQTHKMEGLFSALLEELKIAFPKEAGPYLLESGFLQGRHELDKAIAAAEKGLALQDSTANRTQLAGLVLEKGDMQRAEKLLTEAIGKDSKNIPARVLLAQIYLKQKNSQKALDALDMLIKNVPQRPDVATEAAQAYFMKGDLVKARGFVERSLVENKRSVALHSMMAKIEFAQGSYKDALDEVDLLGNYALVQPDILYVGVLSSFSLSQKDKASAYTDALKKIAPDTWASLHSQSLVALSRKDRKTAYDAAERAMTLFPQRPQALALYADIAPSVITLKQTIGRISSICSQNETASCHMILSRLMESSGDVDNALFQLKEAAKLESDNASLAHAIAQFYVRHNMIKKAMDEYEALVNKKPNDLKAAFMLAQLNQSQGNFKDAKKVYVYIMERDPKNVLAANNLAWILADSGSPTDLTEALRLAQIAKEKFPEDPRIADTLGYVYLKKGLVQNSLGQFQLALEKMPKEPTINSHMAMALVQLSRKPEARRYAEAALGSKAPFAERDQTQDLLRKISSQ